MKQQGFELDFYYKKITSVINGESDAEIIGFISDNILQIIYFEKSVIFKKKFFEKLCLKHKELTTDDIKIIVNVLHAPDEIFYVSKEHKLKYLKKIDDHFYGLLSLRDDVETKNSSPATYIKTSNKKYISKQKTIGIKIY